MTSKMLLTVILLSALLISLMAGLQVVEVAKANFYMPPANTVWNIQCPQNSTYETNYLALRFTVETNLGLLYFYSLDGQEKKEINTTTTSLVPLPEYPPFIDGRLWNRRTHQAQANLPYLPMGTHELTIYQIYPLSKEYPENGNVVSKALIQFNVTSNLPVENTLPTTNPTASPQPPISSTPPSPSPTPTPTATSSPTPPPSPTLSPVKAQEPLNLTIKPDGSVEPSTDLLERNGNTYTFRGDIFDTIWVQTNNIIIDGAGHTLQGNGINTGQNTEIGILLGGPDLSHRECQTVLIKNLRIYNIPRGIFTVGGSNNSIVGNYFDKSGIEIQGNANNTGDLIEHNTFINATVGFDYNPNGTDILKENNFVNSTIFLWLSNPPIVDRNYWSDYTAKYPHSKEMDNSGIWDTPYVYGAFQGINSSNDNHPLVNPITDFEITNFKAASPSPSLTPFPSIPEFPSWIILPLFIFGTVLVAVTLKRKYYLDS